MKTVPLPAEQWIKMAGINSCPESLSDTVS